MTPLVSAVDSASAFDLRWTSWLEAGVAQDRVWHRRATIAAAVAFSALGAWLAVTIYLA
jgi:hypothetical protein